MQTSPYKCSFWNVSFLGNNVFVDWWTNDNKDFEHNTWKHSLSSVHSRTHIIHVWHYFDWLSRILILLNRRFDVNSNYSNDGMRWYDWETIVLLCDYSVTLTLSRLITHVNMWSKTDTCLSAKYIRMCTKPRKHFFKILKKKLKEKILKKYFLFA